MKLPAFFFSLALLATVGACTAAELSQAGTPAPDALAPSAPTSIAATPEPAPTVAPVQPQPGTSAGALSLGPGLHDFTLPDAHGGEVTLSQYLGEKVVVLTFYRAWW